MVERAREGGRETCVTTIYELPFQITVCVTPSSLSSFPRPFFMSIFFFSLSLGYPLVYLAFFSPSTQCPGPLSLPPPRVSVQFVLLLLFSPSVTHPPPPLSVSSLFFALLRLSFLTFSQFTSQPPPPPPLAFFFPPHPSLFLE